MSTTVIHVKLDTKTKNEAKALAHEFGLTLTTLVKALLKQITRTKQISLRLDETPTEYFENSLTESTNDKKQGRISPKFDDVDEAMSWLNNPHKKYENQLHKKVR